MQPEERVTCLHLMTEMRNINRNVIAYDLLYRTRRYIPGWPFTDTNRNPHILGLAMERYRLADASIVDGRLNKSLLVDGGFP